jgi:hypothetical protein
MKKSNLEKDIQEVQEKNDKLHDKSSEQLLTD